MKSRMQYYRRLKLANYIKLGYNPFTIHNNMNEDKDYLNSFNISNHVDDERMDKKISLRDLLRVYNLSKSTIVLITIFNLIILFNLNFQISL